MNSDNEIELATGTQGSEGRSEPVGQQMQGDSPPRTMSTMSSIVMYNFGVGPRFAYVSASARPQNIYIIMYMLWRPSKLAKT